MEQEEHERRCLIQSLRADIFRKTGRRYDRLTFESMDTPSLRELQPLLRDIDTEHAMASQIDSTLATMILFE